MKNAVILAALASTTVAAPFSDYLDAIFGTKESRHAPRPDLIPGFAPIGTGTASGFPFPAPTGAFPAPTGGVQPFRHRIPSLAVDYQLAPRQEAGAGSSLPSFSLAVPTDGTPALPTETEGGFPGLPTGKPDAPFPFPTGRPDVPFPTGGFPKPPGDGPSDIPLPTDLPFPMPTGGSPFPFPGTGIPGLPTTMQTLTRGPRPTGVPELPASENGEEGPGGDAPGGFFDWIGNLFGGGKSETSP